MALAEAVKITTRVMEARSISLEAGAKDVITYKVSGFEKSLHAYRVGARSDKIVWKGSVGRVAVDGELPYIVFSVPGKKGEILVSHNYEKGENLEIAVFSTGKITGIAVDNGIAVASLVNADGTEVRVLDLTMGEEREAYTVESGYIVCCIVENIIVGLQLDGNIGLLRLGGEFTSINPGVKASKLRPGPGKVSFVARNLRDEILVLDPESGEVSRPEAGGRDMEDDKPVEVIDHGWAGDRIWAIARITNLGVKMYFDGKRLKTSLNGTPRRALWVRDRLVVEYSSVEKPPSLALVDPLDKKGSARELPVASRKDKVVNARTSTEYLVSKNGLRIPVLIIEPSGGTGSIALYIHDGPWERVDNSWNPVIALLLLLGYTVVAPNYRGSQGEGGHYASLVMGDPGSGDLLDVLETAEWARNMSETGRIVLVGPGYGGYLALLAASTKPRLFESVVALDPILEWHKEYKTSDVWRKASIRELFKGDEKLMRERSVKPAGRGLPRLLVLASERRASQVLEYVPGVMKSGTSITLHLEPTITQERILLETASFLKSQ